ncbi:hypothetical protein J7L13_00405 [bacterium]|nr:hypothetical protein [bacterium]
MDSRINIFVRAVDQASGTLEDIGQSVKGLAKSFDFLKDAAKVAAGMLMRDAIKGAIDFMASGIELSAKLESLKASFERLVRASGATNLSLESLRKATKGAVSDIELLQAANQALMLGVPADKLNELFEAAMKLGYAAGQSATKSIQDLTTALGRQSPRILDNLGITFEAAAAYEWYARQIGKTSGQLTENEKKLAWQKYAMMMVAEKANALGDNISEAQLKLDQYRASVENSKAATGGFMQSLLDFGMAIRQTIPPLGVLLDIIGPSGLQTIIAVTAGNLIPQLIAKLWAWKGASIALALAEKARAIATFIANAVASMGAAVPIMLAAIAAGVAALALHFAGVFQEGGIVPRTGWAYVHQGEIIIPPNKFAVLSPPPKEVRQYITVYPTINIENVSGDVDLEQVIEAVDVGVAKAVLRRLA